MSRATARACSNLALVKYWGKRDEALVLPYTGSLSVTLDALVSTTSVEFTGTTGPDEVSIDGARAAGPESARVTALLDLVRAELPQLGAAIVTSVNGFPAASGLASSASGFAALAAAAVAASGRSLSETELSILARRGSGSACRSVPGGFVEWVRGVREDGSDSVAVQRLAPGDWDVGLVVAVVDAGRKRVGSREAMQASVATSPFYEAWVRTAGDDLEEARAALAARDLARLGEVAERNAFAMHAVALSTRPSLRFWSGATLALLSEVEALRARGIGAWATIDAGPHVGVLCAADRIADVSAALASVRGVHAVVPCRPGPGVAVL